jgi:hypothetical protein
MNVQSAKKNSKNKGDVKGILPYALLDMGYKSTAGKVCPPLPEAVVREHTYE